MENVCDRPSLKPSMNSEKRTFMSSMRRESRMALAIALWVIFTTFLRNDSAALRNPSSESQNILTISECLGFCTISPSKIMTSTEAFSVMRTAFERP